MNRVLPPPEKLYYNIVYVGFVKNRHAQQLVVGLVKLVFFQDFFTIFFVKVIVRKRQPSFLNFGKYFNKSDVVKKLLTGSLETSDDAGISRLPEKHPTIQDLDRYK